LPTVSRTSSPPRDVDDFEELFEPAHESETPAHHIDEDEALALRLMQEDVDQSGRTTNNSNDGVRSPIAARNDILVHPDMDYDSSYGYLSRGRGRRRGIL
jgi:hypothetical protein